MKIYNKKTFMSGEFLIVLGVPTLIINILEKDVDVNIVILAVTLSAFGFSSVIRSISCKKTKEDKLDELDERNCLIKLKVQSKSFQITQIVSFVLMFFLLVMGKVSGNKEFIIMGVGIAFALCVLMFSELCTSMYYEFKN